MILRTFLVILSIGAFGLGFHLHNRNLVLEGEIAASEEDCKRQVAELENSFNAKINALQQRLPQQQRQVTVATKADEPEPEQEQEPVRYDKLVSYGHQVQAVVHKYEFLLGSAMINDTEKHRLRRLLMERERLVNAINLANNGSPKVNADPGQLETDLEDVEQQIQVVLIDPLDYQRYQFLSERAL